MQDVADPLDVAKEDRIVEIEFLADRLDAFRGRFVTGKDDGRVPRGEVDQSEDEQRDEEQQGYCCEQSPAGVSEHLLPRL
ncbi:hypothetical protein GCM10027610_041920 [Dactylosporangium cerinum]